MIPKPGKELTEVSSYRPISLLPVVSKTMERLLLQRLDCDVPPEGWIPDHQFGFRHSTIQQIHRITHAIQDAIENKHYCSAVFLDVSQAFDKVWHRGLLYKIKKILPLQYCAILKSYLSDREFQVVSGEAKSEILPIKSGVPQGSVLGPLLYLLYTHDLPRSRNIELATFADDIAIISTHENPRIASLNLQVQLNTLQHWLNRWKIKVNETKSVHTIFSLCKQTCPGVSINNVSIPQSSVASYLGIHLDSRLTWKAHITKKKKQMELKMKELYWLIGRRSNMSLENKILIYKTVIKPIWTYGIALWGCASKSNVAIIQRCQPKFLRQIVDAPWYVSNRTIHFDLKIPMVQEVIHEMAAKHNNKLEVHPNTVVENLLTPRNNKRLKRQWPTDLV